MPIPVPARSKVWVCGRSLAEIVGSNPTGRMSVASIVCCGLDANALGWSLVKRSPTEFGVFECDREASITRNLWPTRGCCAIKNIYYFKRPPCFESGLQFIFNIPRSRHKATNKQPCKMRYKYKSHETRALNKHAI